MMSFYRNETVRSYAITCQPDILQSAVSAMEAKRVDVQTVRHVFLSVLRALVQCFASEPLTSLMVLP